MNPITLRASSLARLEICPASFYDEDAPPAPPSEDAERGTMLHSICLEGGDPSKLSPADAEIAERTIEMVARLAESPADVQYIEQAMEFECNGATLTGHPDMIEIRGTHALICDLKFGFLAVSDASVNLQLAAYAIMIAAKHRELETFELVIVQPLVKGQGSRIVMDKAGLRRAYQRIAGIVDAIRDAEEARIPTPNEDACRYCKLLPICSAHRPAITQLASIDTSAQRWEMVPKAEKLALWFKIKAAKKAIAAIEYLYRLDLEANPSAFDGQIFLGNVRTTREITDAPGLFAHLSRSIGLSADAFTKAVKVQLTNLKPVVKANQALKGKAFNEWFDATLAPFCETSTSKGSLETAK